MQDIKRGCEKMLRLRTYKNSDARKIVSWLTEEEAFSKMGGRKITLAFIRGAVSAFCCSPTGGRTHLSGDRFR